VYGELKNKITDKTSKSPITSPQQITAKHEVLNTSSYFRICFTLQKIKVTPTEQSYAITLASSGDQIFFKNILLIF